MVRLRVISGYICFLACASAQNVISTVAGGNPPVTPVAAVNAAVGDPARVGTDAAGNFYFGSLHSVFRVNSSGVLQRIAGNGRAGYTGDGGPATGAQLFTPVGIAVDSAGNVYVADLAASVVRRIAPGGTIATIAGTGTAGYNGDGGPAAQAQLNGPMGLAVDGAGNLFVADTGNHRIRKIAANGAISTVAGNGSAGYGSDGGPATGTELNQPEGVAVDAGGNLYIADTMNDRVREVTANGNITTVAGTGLSAVYGSVYDETGVSTTTGDNGPATSAAVVLPTDVAMDAAGSLYIADYGNARIRVVTKGIIRAFAGSAAGGIPLISGQAAAGEQLNGPTGLAVDGGGNVYFAEGSIGSGSGLGTGDYRIWVVNGGSGILSAAAGNGLESYAGDGGAASLAELNGPAGIAIDQSGTLYLADSANHRIRRVTASGAIETFAGTGTAGYAGDGGPAKQAQLNRPTGVAVDATGNVYISDTDNNRIRKVSSDGTVYTIAGNGNASFYGDGLVGGQASLHAPGGLAMAPDGTLYVADTLNQRVRKLTASGVISTVAGNGLAGFSGDGGQGTAAALNQPASVALDAAGNLYIADLGNNRVRALSPQGYITTVAGNGSNGSSGDGSAATGASLAGPQGVAVDGAGNLYIAQSGGNTLREVASGGAISTVAGSGACCYSGDGGPPLAAALNSPWNVAVDATGNIYFTDYGNNAVRVVGLSDSTPAIGSVVNGASNQVAPIASGELVVIYGSGLGPRQLAQAVGTSSTQIAGVSVLFNGVPGQVQYVSAAQVSAVAPVGLSGSSVQVAIAYGSLASNTVNVPVAAAAPAVVTDDGSGSGQAAAINQDGSLNGIGNPASAANTITLLATGTASFVPSVTIGGQAATVISTATAEPGVVSIVVQIPGGLGTGSFAVTVVAGGVTSPGGVTVAVD